MTWFEKRAFWQIVIIALFSGALMSFALAPFFFMPVCFLGFTILVFLFDGLSKRHKKWLKFFLTGWAFGFGYFLSNLWWLANALTVDNAVPLFLVPIAVAVLPAGLALFWGFAGLLCSFFWKAGASRIFCIAFAFGLAEWLRGTCLTGFPWGAIGYAAMPTPMLMQSSVLFGLYGMNALAVFIFAAPAIFFGKAKKAAIIIPAILLIIFHIGFGFYRLHYAPALEKVAPNALWARIIQPSIDQSIKLNMDTRYQVLSQLLELVSLPSLQNHTPDIIVWPETSEPYFLDYSPQVRKKIAAAMPDKSFSLIGTARAQEDETGTRYFNTIQALDKNGDILASSDKLHLVPFGEYLPFTPLLKAIGFSAVAEIAGGYSTGTTRHTVTLPNGLIYLPLICYEIIFPTEMQFEGPAPSVIINVTNDAWYGDTPGPAQHLHQAQVRAIEQGLPVIRAANNGISAVIDAYGRLYTTLGYNKVGVIDAPIPPVAVSIWNNGLRLSALIVIFFAFAFGVVFFKPRFT